MAEKIELPRKNYSEVSQEHRRILGEFYDFNKNRQWFRRAELVELHPNHMKPTLEVYCDYNPVLEMKDILQFTGKYNLALEIVPLSHQG